MRILIEYLLPVLLPTILWVAWLMWRQRAAAAQGQPEPGWDSVPWSWLFAAGGVLALLIAVGGSLASGYSTGHYEPAHLDSQGKIVPGRFD